MESSFNQAEIDDYLAKLENLIKNVETNLKNCSKKYNDKGEVEQLYSSLTNFLLKENLNDSKLNEDVLMVEKDLRRCPNESVRRKFFELKEKFKCLNTELKSMKTMLEKCKQSWSKFNESYEVIEKWLDEQENLNDLSETDFTNYQKYQKLHSQFNESANFLLQVSEQKICSNIKEKLLYINKLWKSYQDKFKDTNLESCLKFYECEHSLNMIKERLQKIENLINRSFKFNSSSGLKYKEELEKANNDLECLNQNLNLILKLGKKVQFKDEQKLNEFLNEVKNTETKLTQIVKHLPDYLSKISKFISDLPEVENGLQNIENWLLEGDNLVKIEPDIFNFEQIKKQIEKQKKHFNDLYNQESLINQKLELFSNLKQIKTQNLDLNDLNSKLYKLKEFLNNLKTKRLKWEELFNTQQSLWNDFNIKTKQLEQWIMQAQKIVSEKNDDFNFLIKKHKNFFDNINNEILHGFLGSGQKLLEIKSNKKDIKLLMDTLEGQWKMILCHAPIRLLKLQFKNLESLLKKELKEADDEINEEFNELNRNGNITEIIKRHEKKFKNSDFYSLCQTYLSGMKNCKLELVDKKVDDKTYLEDAFDNLELDWKCLNKKIDDLNARLVSCSEDSETNDRNLSMIDKWLDEVDSTSKSLFDYNLNSSFEYKKCLERIKELLNDSEQNENILNQSINSISLNNHLKHEIKHKFDKFKTKDLFKIKQRIDYLTSILQISSKIDQISNKIRDLSQTSSIRFMSEEDDMSLQSAVEEHKTILDQMRIYEKEIDQLKLEANNLTSGDYLQIPTVIYEKINCVQENIRHCISEELERRSSLLEIKQFQDQKLSKLDALNQNLELIENIISNKDPDKPISPRKTPRKVNFSNEKLIQDDKDDEDESKQTKYSKYLKRLTKCKIIIDNSRRLITEIKQQSNNLSRSHTPSLSDQQIREIENKFDSFEHEIDLQVEHFELNLEKQKKIDSNLECLNTKLNNILDKFEQYNHKLDSLELEHEKILQILEQLDILKKELNQLIKEKRELLEDDSKNLSRSKIGTLLEGFNETILELDLQKDNDLNLKINQFIIDLNLAEENYKLKLNDIKNKLNEDNLNKKQLKLNYLKNTLDLQLDTLIGLTKLNDNQDDFDDDLRKETENILVESLNETTQILKNSDSEEERVDEITVDYVITSNCLINKFEVMFNQEQESKKTEMESLFRIEQEKLELERQRAEKEALERQKLEFELERLKQIELEREEKLKQERLEIERLRAERLEREKKEQEKKEQEKKEQEKLKIIKQKEHEDAEQFRLLEKQKKVELEEIENEKRRKKLEQLEQERIRNQEKLKLEFKLKDICEELNFLKQKINSIKSTELNDEDKFKLIIKSYQDELSDLDDQVLALYSESLNLENKKINPSNSDYYLFDSLDQATLTQFELIQSFLSHLNSQIELKKKEFHDRNELRFKLNENEINLEKYTQLAIKLNSTEDEDMFKIHVKNIDDLESRIKSIESVEHSIQNCFKQLFEINKSLENFDQIENISLKKKDFELKILQPLLMNLARLKQYLNDWRQFEDLFTNFKNFLFLNIKIDQLVELKRKESESEPVLNYSSSLSLENEVEKFNLIRESLTKKLTESDDLFRMGSNLFNSYHGQDPCVLVPESCKDFNETKECVEDIMKYLDEKCSILNYIYNEYKKLDNMEQASNRLQFEKDQIELKDEVDNLVEDKVVYFKNKLDKLSDLKKKLRALIDDMNTSSSTNEFFSQKLVDVSKKFNSELKNRLKDTFKTNMDKITNLEIEYHQTIMKNLPSRNSLSELTEWLKSSVNKLNQLEIELEKEKPIEAKRLEYYKKDVLLLKEEMMNERELDLKFILESIDREIKQGFYDLGISEKSTQLESDWNRFKSKLNSALERADICILKLNEFNRSIQSLKIWVSDKNKQYELENTTKFKTGWDEASILMDELPNMGSIEDEKELIKQLLTLNQELEELKSVWLGDKIVNEPSIRILIYEKIVTEFETIKNNLDNIEMINKIKIENDLTQLKSNYNNKINNLNSSLENEVNFVKNGKLTSIHLYSNSIENLKQILEKLETTRSDMKQSLNKFEFDLKSHDLKQILNLAKARQTSLLLDPSMKHTILNNLTNRDLENSARNLIYEAEKELIENWKKYDELLKLLSSRLDQANECLNRDLKNLEFAINSENLIFKSNLFEQTLSDMIRNRTLFENLETLTEPLCKLNENLRLELNQNRIFIQEKFSDLSNLADCLSSRLQQASLEHKSFLSLVENTEQILFDLNEKLNLYTKVDSKYSNDLKRMVDELERNESKLKEQLNSFKNLNIKDSERISKIYELSSECTNCLSKHKELRLKLLDQIQEKNYSIDIKLNDMESFLNSYSNYLSEQFSSENDLLNKYLNCMKYMVNNDFELIKSEKLIDELEIETQDETQKLKLKNFRDKILKFRKQNKLITIQDGLLQKLSKLKEITSTINEIDLKKVEEVKLIDLKENFLNLKFSIEKLLEKSQSLDLFGLNKELFKNNCLNSIESKLNNLINEFLRVKNLKNEFDLKSEKFNVDLNDVEHKLKASVQLENDFNSLESKLNELSEIKMFLTSDKFKSELDNLENMSKSFNNDYQSKKIRYLNLICDLDKLIKKFDFNFNYIKKIVDKSQKMLDLIKQSHKLLTKISKNDPNCLEYVKLNIIEKLNENEPVKNEILDLYSNCLMLNSSQNFIKTDLIKDIIDKLLYEWNLINEKCLEKVKKFEIHRTKLNEMELKLNKIREYCCSLESYIDKEMFKNFDLSNLKEILAKKLELENLYECVKQKDLNTENLLKSCLSAFKFNKQTTSLVLSLKERWFNLKLLIKDKLFKLSNCWLYLCDLNDQIENFYLLIEKTEIFYKKCLNKDLVFDNFHFFTLIDELYSTINQDCKLIKYLNESFLNFSKFIHGFESTECLIRLKSKLIDINSKWDGLHNEIAIRIKIARKNHSKFTKQSTTSLNDKLDLWTNEINLLILNLEHISTNELQFKQNDVEEIKKEICQQTELIFKNEIKFKIDSDLIDRIKDLMKRILRLDSYIKQTSINYSTARLAPTYVSHYSEYLNEF